MRAEGSVGLGRWILFWSIALGGACFDLATKSIIFSRVAPPPNTVPLVPNILELHRSQNTGALWASANLPYSSQIFAGLSVVAAIVICYWLFYLPQAAESLVLTMALGLIMAGALGNCYDRVFLGYVRDFVHFHVDAIGFDCAIFNFADNMLVLGALTLVLYALKPEVAAQPDAAVIETLPSAGASNSSP